jgi:hypothetical protein
MEKKKDNFLRQHNKKKREEKNYNRQINDYNTLLKKPSHPSLFSPIPTN